MREDGLHRCRMFATEFSIMPMFVVGQESGLSEPKEGPAQSYKVA